MFYGIISNLYFTCIEEKGPGSRVITGVEFKVQGDQGVKTAEAGS